MINIKTHEVHKLSLNYHVIFYHISQEKLPQISVTQVGSSSDIPFIHITFPNGEEDNMILERHYPNQQSRMIGRVYKSLRVFRFQGSLNFKVYRKFFRNP